MLIINNLLKAFPDRCGPARVLTLHEKLGIVQHRDKQSAGATVEQQWSQLGSYCARIIAFGAEEKSRNVFIFEATIIVDSCE